MKELIFSKVTNARFMFVDRQDSAVQPGLMAVIMKKTMIFISIFAILLTAIPAIAVSPAGQQYINEIVGGGRESLRNASKSIYRTELTERAVLDVLAEKLLQNYNYRGRAGVDAVAWACKALGRSGDLRYKNVLETVMNRAENRKIRKYAKKSLRMMPPGKAEHPYRKGNVNLSAMRRKLAKGQSPVPGKKRPAKRRFKNKSGKKMPLSAVRKGMSLREVNALIGYPTSTTAHLTGKTFIPFYFGGDTARRINLYKGRGRILFTHASAFSRAWRVREIQIDPKEPGYR